MKRMICCLFLLQVVAVSKTQVSSAASTCLFVVYHRAIPFYFDSIVDGGAFLDVFGRIVVRPDTGAVDVSIETRSRWGKVSDSEDASGRGRPVESTIRVKPEKIVELQLPKLADRQGSFGNRVLSIRIRARQLR